jgi:hypothetical protein
MRTLQFLVNEESASTLLEKGGPMGIYVKNGTPLRAPSLCESCARGFIAQGYSETDLLVVCQALWPERRMHFTVRACTAYTEKNKPTFKEMEEIALELDRVALKRDAGFVRVDSVGKGAEKIDPILNENSN